MGGFRPAGGVGESDDRSIRGRRRRMRHNKPASPPAPPHTETARSLDSAVQAAGVGVAVHRRAARRFAALPDTPARPYATTPPPPPTCPPRPPFGARRSVRLPFRARARALGLLLGPLRRRVFSSVHSGPEATGLLGGLAQPKLPFRLVRLAVFLLGLLGTSSRCPRTTLRTSASPTRPRRGAPSSLPATAYDGRLRGGCS